jgi:hypothetical protein
MSKSHRTFDIRVGDKWMFHANTGTILRTITLIGSKLISYRDDRGIERVCRISTFRRWWRGAELFFATDWEGRGVDP